MSDTLEVLVVVDVQNCFMANAMSRGAGDFLHQTDIVKCHRMIKEIDQLSMDKNLIVFTRDFHPLGHSSFGEGITGRGINPPVTWPAHCRNKKSDCLFTGEEQKSKIADYMPAAFDTPLETVIQGINKTNQELQLTLDEDVKEYMINGPQLSYMFLFADNLKSYFKQYYTKSRADDLIEIGLKPQVYKHKEVITVNPNFNSLNFNVDNCTLLDGNNNQKAVLLTKGQYCKYESYSAFNYHLGPTGPVPGCNEYSKYSTGLWEYILNSNNGAKKHIKITICGLVGDVCVINSYIQGYYMWKNIYSKEYPNINVTFVYSFKGTLFTPPEAGIDPFHRNVPSALELFKKGWVTSIHVWETILGSTNGSSIIENNFNKTFNDDANRCILISVNNLEPDSVITALGGSKQFLCKMCNSYTSKFNMLCKFCKKHKTRRRSKGIKRVKGSKGSPRSKRAKRSRRGK